MALLNKFKTHTSTTLLEISERVYVFDSCLGTDDEEDDTKLHTSRSIVDHQQLKQNFPESCSFMVFSFWDKGHMAASLLSESDTMTVVEYYSSHYAGCPLPPMLMIHHFLNSAQTWLSAGQHNLLLIHCEPCGWPAMAFMLAALLIHRKKQQCTSDHHWALQSIYEQAPRELLLLASGSIDPLPSQLRYLEYVSWNVGYQLPPPLNRTLRLECIVLALALNMDGCCSKPAFRIMGRDSFNEDQAPKLLFGSQHYEKADCQVVKVEIDCNVEGDVVIECVGLDSVKEREDVMMFRVIFHTAFVSSKVLVLTREQIDTLRNFDKLPKDFNVKVMFSEMEAAAPTDLVIKEIKESHYPKAVSVKDLEESNDVGSIDTVMQSKIPEPIHDASKTVLSSEPPSDAKSVEASSSSETNLQGTGNEQQGMCVLIKVPAPSKIITPRIPQTPGATNLSQGSSITVSRYPNAAAFSGLGITALLHDHASPPTTHECPRSVSLSPTAVSSQVTNVGKFVKQSPPSSQSVVKASECTEKASAAPALSTLNATDESSTEHSEPPIRKLDKFPVPPPPLLPPFLSNSYRSPLVKFSPPAPPPPPPLPSVSKAFIRKPASKTLSPTTLLPPLPALRSSPFRQSAAPPAPPPPPLSLWKASSQKTVAFPPSNSGRSLSPSAKHVVSSKLDHSSQPFKSLSVISRPCLHPVSVPLPPTPPMKKQNNISINSEDVPSMPQPPPAPSAKGLTKASFGATTNRNAPPPAPGPPSLSSFGGKDRRSRNQVQTRKASLKPYHWLKLTRVTQGSIWAEAHKSNDTFMTPEFDISELESLFSSTSLNSDMKGTGVKSKRRTSVLKTDKVQLIELRRAYNCEIMLTKVKIPLHELTSSVLALDDSVLDVDQVDSLVKFCPTKEEMELLKGYKGDKESLGKCEQFFLELMKVQRVESKLRVFSFKMQFSQQVSDLRRNLNVVNSAAEEIRSSKKFKRIMQSVLSLGNALNQGTARGSAVGFRLDSLLKLTDTRSRNNKITLMHYLCKVLAEKLPELLDFSKDLVSLEAATKIQLKYLAEEMQAISRGLEKVIQELVASENDGAVSEYFCKILRAFLSYAEGEVKSLASLYSIVGRNADALALYFGEDPTRCPFEQVVSTLLNFARILARAHEENCKRVEYEKRKAEKEAEKQRMLLDDVGSGGDSKREPVMFHAIRSRYIR